jgi:hypothetical protein
MASSVSGNKPLPPGRAQPVNASRPAMHTTRRHVRGVRRP